MVSEVRIRLDSRKSVRPFKVIICDDVSEFESYHLSHAVGSLWARQASWIELRFKSPLDDLNGKPECSMVQVDAYAVQNYRELARDGDCGLSLLVV
jgi:hypothetical protein